MEEKCCIHYDRVKEAVPKPSGLESWKTLIEEAKV